MNSMQAIQIRSPGAADVLELCTRPLPQAGMGEVLIRVAAAGINRPDVLQRLGQYRAPPGASDLPGLEVAGTIVGGDVGDSGFAIGDAVCALTPGGGYAEYCCAPASHCLPVPRGWSLLEAASLPETCFTVWSNLFERADLAPGETVLIHGGSSGIGVTAIQLAAARGHRVFATAGSADKCAACVRLGAERAIDYRREDFVAEIKALTAQRGVDVILDIVGGDYVTREIGCLADDGRIVLIGLLGGSRAEIPLAQVLLRRLTLSGSTLRPRSIGYKARLARELREQVWPLIEAGHIRPVIDRVYPLAQAADAHRRMEEGAHIGKLVLQVA